MKNMLEYRELSYLIKIEKWNNKKIKE